MKRWQINMVIFPNVTQLDLTAPFEVFARMPDTNVSIVAETGETIVSDRGLRILPDCTFAEAQPADILFVPGGPGVNAGLTNDNLMDFLIKQSENVQYITSVCTGSLLLARAGLLRGYRATSHWNALDFLTPYGVEATNERVVVDRNRITGGGVTAGIDMALTLAAEIFGKETAQSIQLQMEYHPKPPFKSGHPSVAPKSILKKAYEDLQNLRDIRSKIISSLRIYTQR